MHQRFYGRTELYKRAKRCNSGHLAFYHSALLESFYFLQPWIFLHLFEAEAEAVFIDGNDFGFDSLTGFYIVAGVFNTFPGDFRDVNQAFNTINIYKSAEVNNTSYNALYSIANLEFREASLHVVFYGFLFGENQFVIFAADVEDACSDGLVGKLIELL